MFTLSAEEFQALRSQFATSNDQAPERGGRRYAPRVFTEHGALMAATILNSPRAVEVSIFVVRSFVRVRELAELKEKTTALAMNNDTFSHKNRAQPKNVFGALRELMTPPDLPKRPTGFVMPDDKGKKTAEARSKA
jgi:hypothetical protein